MSVVILSYLERETEVAYRKLFCLDLLIQQDTHQGGEHLQVTVYLGETAGATLASPLP